MNRKPTILIGLGSVLMTDEGVGVAVVREIEGREGLPPGLEITELGTGGLAVLHAMDRRDKAVFVDCCYMGEPPGTARRFTPEQVRSRKITARQSLHEGDLLGTIDLARRLGRCPDEVVIFGIQPQAVEPGEDLSPVLRDALPGYADQVLEEFRAA
jgi:hydrogenase maturation protease